MGRGGRIGPACAGKRMERRYQKHEVEDHPRMCGEKKSSLRRVLNSDGSPPHVRGKADGTVIGGHQRRITPACAGKSSARVTARALFWDHPRMCGEKYSLQGLPIPHRGSPPHVRGKDGHERHHHQLRRITPACAGKSFGPHKRCLFRRDHPRMCGEK